MSTVNFMIFVGSAMLVALFYKYQLKVLDALYLDGYNSLYDKYHDYSTVNRAEHNYIVENRRAFKADMFRNKQFRVVYMFKQADRNNDWDTMLELILEYWDIELNDISDEAARGRIERKVWKWSVLA